MTRPEYLVIITGLSGSGFEFILRREAPKDLGWRSDSGDYFVLAVPPEILAALGIN
ncbi:MAG TPA: hypothetical protein VGA33_05545 [Thermoanaerobaculia bacterium]